MGATTTALAAYLLVGAMLSVMAARVAGPFGQRPSGRVLAEHRLSVRERLLLHRTSMYAIGAVLLAGALTGSVPRVAELIGILGALGIVLRLRATYVFTDEGVGLNAVVFRRWSEFAGVDETRGALRLRGRPTMGDFSVVSLPGAARQRVLRVIADWAGNRPR